MTAKYARHVSTKQTPQSEAIPGRSQVSNSAGGFVFQVDDWTRLERFLILGNEGGTYYTSERKLTQENAACVLRCAELDPAATVSRVVAISEAGRAPKNDPAVFALALLATHAKAKQAALAAVPTVCRIPTHLFAFAEMVQELRGWGRGLKRAIGSWYTSKKPRDLAYQCAKYQSRNGWTHRDLLRLSHPTATGTTQEVLHWAVKGWNDVGDAPHDNADLLPIWAMERAKRATDVKEIVGLIRDFDLVRECIPTQFLTDPSVWDALLEKMPLMAMVRNLATMTRIGLVAPLSAATKTVCDRLGDGALLKKARVHPVALLIAQKTYAAGKSERGSSTWTPVSQVSDALDGAFYVAFGAVEPTGKRWLLALDVSGSMSAQISGIPGLSCREASAALALVTAATEPQHAFVAFTSGGQCATRSMHAGYPSGISPLDISPKQRLDAVMRKTAGLNFGGTDCALPMIWAKATKTPVDAFVVLTDNETWAGNIHPCQALRDYRQAMGIGAKLIVVGMTATQFSIADPTDAGMIDVTGFDANVPSVMSQFAAGA